MFILKFPFFWWLNSSRNITQQQLTKDGQTDWQDRMHEWGEGWCPGCRYTVEGRRKRPGAVICCFVVDGNYYEKWNTCQGIWTVLQWQFNRVRRWFILCTRQCGWTTHPRPSVETVVDFKTSSIMPRECEPDPFSSHQREEEDQWLTWPGLCILCVWWTVFVGSRAYHLSDNLFVNNWLLNLINCFQSRTGQKL